MAISRNTPVRSVSHTLDRADKGLGKFVEFVARIVNTLINRLLIVVIISVNFFLVYIEALTAQLVMGLDQQMWRTGAISLFACVTGMFGFGQLNDYKVLKNIKKDVNNIMSRTVGQSFDNSPIKDLMIDCIEDDQGRFFAAGLSFVIISFVTSSIICTATYINIPFGIQVVGMDVYKDLIGGETVRASESPELALKIYTIVISFVGFITGYAQAIMTTSLIDEEYYIRKSIARYESQVMILEVMEEYKDVNSNFSGSRSSSSSSQGSRSGNNTSSSSAAQASTQSSSSAASRAFVNPVNNLREATKVMKEVFGTGFNERDFEDFVYKKCGMDPVTKTDYVVYPGITDPDVEKFINAETNVRGSGASTAGATSPSVKMVEFEKILIGSDEQDTDGTGVNLQTRGLKFIINQLSEIESLMAKKEDEIADTKNKIQENKKKADDAKQANRASDEITFSAKVRAEETILREHDKQYAALDDSYKKYRRSKDTTTEALKEELTNFNFTF